MPDPPASVMTFHAGNATVKASVHSRMIPDFRKVSRTSFATASASHATAEETHLRTNTPGRCTALKKGTLKWLLERYVSYKDVAVEAWRIFRTACNNQ